MRYKHKWIPGIALSLLLLLSALPSLLERIVTHQLIVLGFDAAGIHDIDINYFSGEISVEGLSVIGAKEPLLSLGRLRLNIGWQKIASARIGIDDIRVDNLSIKIEQIGQQFKIAGISLPTSESNRDIDDKETKLPLIDIGGISLNNIHLSYRGDFGDHQIVLNQLDIGAINTSAPQQAIALTLNSHINDAELSFHGDTQPFAQTRTLKGNLNLNRFTVERYQSLIKDFDIKGSVDLGVNLNASHAKSGAINIGLDGDIVIQGAEVVLNQPQRLSAGFNAFKWDGTLYYTNSSERSPSMLNGQIQMDAIRIDDLQNTITLADIKTVTINEFDLSSDLKLDIPLIEILDVSALKERDAALYRLNQLLIEQVLFDKAEGLAANQVMFNGQHLDITKNEDGSIKTLSKILSTANHGTEKSSDEPSKPIAVVINRIAVSQGSSIRFIDKSVKPVFNTATTIKQVEIADINTAAPNQPILFKLETQIGDYGNIALNGDVLPLKQPIALNTKGRVKQVELPPFTPYLEPAIGYQLSSGMAFADINIDIHQSKINGEMKMDIRKLELEPSNEEKIAKFSKKLSMPLPTALNILRKDDDSINLTFPISGDLNNPDIDINDVINTALSKTLKTGSIFYLKSLLQPYSAILFVAGIAKDLLTGISLEPVVFESENLKIDPTHEEYLLKIAELLKSRQLELKICSIYTDTEKSLMEQQMKPERGESQDDFKARVLELMNSRAKGRAESVKHFLVQQEVNSEQLFICLPKMDSDKDAKSRVELLI